MKIRVDKAKCTGHAQCYAVSPELFPVDDLGYSALEGARTVSEPELHVARAGVAACPEIALVLESEGADADR